MTSPIDQYVDHAAYTPPLVTGDPVPIADRVFVIADRQIPLVPNVGFVVGDRAVMVVDTGVGATNGRLVLEHARSLAPRKPVYLAITQLDPGHAFGAQAFANDATIVYSAAQRQRLHLHAESYATTFRALGPDVAGQLAGLRLVEPHIVFDSALEIDLGGVGVHLRDWGPAHTGDDATVFVDRRVLFTGDLLQSRMFPILPYFPPFDTDFDGDAWIEAVEWILRAAPAIVVPGHGEVADLKQVQEVHDYLTWMRAEVAARRAAGSSLDDVIATVEPMARSRWPDWDAPHWIRLIATALYRSA